MQRTSKALFTPVVGKIAVLTLQFEPPIRPDFFWFRTQNFESGLTPHLVPPIRSDFFRFRTRNYESGLTPHTYNVYIPDYLALFKSRLNPAIAVPTPRWQQNCGTKVTSAKAKQLSQGFQQCLLFRSQASTMSYSIGQE